MATRKAQQAQALKESGVIDKMARNQRAFKLEGNDTWYSVFKAPQMNGAEVGSTVEFEYTTKDSGGTTFYNVEGNVQITSAAPKRATASGGSTNSKDLTITRGGLVKAAAELVAATLTSDSNVEEAAQDTVAVAQILEAYIYGEEEEEEA